MASQFEGPLSQETTRVSVIRIWRCKRGKMYDS